MRAKSAAVIVSLICGIIATAPAYADTVGSGQGRIFILNAEVGPTVNISERDLLARIRQELPFEIFKRKKLIYEDISAYLEIKKANLNSKFDALTPENIEQVLADKQMQWMLTFSLSYAPTGKPDGRLLLSGRLYDVDAMKCLLSRAAPDAAAKKSVNTICLGKTQTDHAFVEGSVDLASFDELRGGLHHLFAKLLDFPEVDLPDKLTKTSGPFDAATIDIKTNSNSADTPTLNAEIYRLGVSKTPDVVCRNPEIFFDNDVVSWKEVVDQGSYHAEKIKIDENDISNEASININNKYASLLSTLRLPPRLTEDYFIAKIRSYKLDRGVRLYSYPKYLCLHIREPRRAVGVSLGPLFGQTFFGILGYWFDIALGRSATLGSQSGKISLFSAVRYQLSVGLIQQFVALSKVRASEGFLKAISTTPNLKAHFELDAFRHRKIAIAVFGEVGAGLDIVQQESYIEPEMGNQLCQQQKNLGWYPALVAGLGIKLMFEPKASYRPALELGWQARYRFGTKEDDFCAEFEKLGLADIHLPKLGISFDGFF